MRRSLGFLPSFAIALSLASFVAAAEKPVPPPTPEEATFFESRIRPLLVNNCYECHGAKKQESGLRLDSRAALVAGGDGGTIVVAGEPDKSAILAAVRKTGDIKMPPDKKLAPAEVDALATWIKAGLPWPEAQAAAAHVSPTDDMEIERARTTHWAFQAVKAPTLPTADSKAAEWGIGRVDRFVAAKLAEKQLAPSPRADARPLLRRITFDLTGLPPTPSEAETFVADESPDKIDRLSDRLLSSPRYGERWGRHWLDVARYSDTRGYAFGRERRFPYAYTYRDYVVAAFNSDLPYDRFLTEQLAADKLDLGGNAKPLAALGFLTVGRHFDNPPDDIDDRIDAVTRGMLGLTVGCARCHDHKYDPIPTEDYYSLYGVFASIVEPENRPLIGKATENAGFEAFQKKLKELEKQRDDYVSARRDEMMETARKRAGEYLVAVVTLPPEEGRRRGAQSLRAEDLKPKLVDRWRRYLERVAQPADAVFGPWRKLMEVKESDLPNRVADIVKAISADGAVNPLVKAALVASPPKSRKELASVYGKLLSEIYAKRDDKNPPVGAEPLRKVLVADDSPTMIPRDDVRRFMNRLERNKFNDLQKTIDTHQVRAPGALPRAMSVVDANRLFDPYVFVRGSQFRRGKAVPRQFVKILSGPDRKPFKDGSGRLELARAIVAPDNPLTARVIVNRMWMHHFGQPLVDSPSDFGLRTEAPTHPELLDDLAAELVRSGWSLKHVHRRMLSSSAYQQASLRRADAEIVDPENRLLARMNRRRLEFEAVRDSLAAVSGRLDLRIGGGPVELMSQPFTTRRAVYGLVDRQDLPNLFRVFDFASPDQSSPKRPQTTVPQQALFLMNSPYVQEQAAKLAARPELTSTADPVQRMEALAELAFGRPAAPEEREAALAYLSSGDMNKLWPRYVQALLMTNEFVFVD